MIKPLLLTLLLCTTAFAQGGMGPGPGTPHSVGGGATAFVSDSFTGTAGTGLGAHVPEVGGAWNKHSSFTAGAIILSDANRLRIDTSNTESAFYYNDETPPSADYDVEIIVRPISSVGAFAGVLGRVATGTVSWYELVWERGDGLLVLRKRFNGAPTDMDTFTVALSNGQDYVFKLEMRGDQIKGYLDGVERVSAIDSAVTAAGFAGLALRHGAGGGSNTTGLHLDTFEASVP